MTPTSDPAKRLSASQWATVLHRIWHRIGADRMSLVSAGVAFFVMLAVFPAVSAVLSIAGMVVDQQLVLGQLATLDGVVPAEVLDIIEQQATAVITNQDLGLALVLSLGIALWSASRGVSVLCDGLNVANDTQETRGLILRNVHVLALTLLLVLGLNMGLVMIIGIPVLLSVFEPGPLVEGVARSGRWIILAGVTIWGLSLVYRYGPAGQRRRQKWFSLGAILACGLWGAASGGFTYYIDNFGSYSDSFGALAGVIILMLWLWISVFVILLGARVNVEIDRARSEKTGPEVLDR